jgi:hypothetical protein
MPHTLYRISFFREGVTWESMPRSYHGLALENGSILAKRASLNAHSSTYYTGLFLHIVLDRPLTVIKRCCMASSCLRISDIVLFYELRVILLAFSFINRTDLWQGHSDGLRVLQACPDLEQNRVLNGLHAPWPQANLYFVNPSFRLHVPPQPPKRLLLQSEKCLFAL